MPDYVRNIKYNKHQDNLAATDLNSRLARCDVIHRNRSFVAELSSLKELKSALPYILHEIFDFEKDQSQGWQLDRIFRSYSTDLFDHIRRFLSPEGPLMKVINCLQADPYALYEFPLKYIPAPARQMIEEGAVPSFYANKLQGQSFSSAVLMLNAFELYMFHLAHALVNPIWQARNQGWSDLYEFLYPIIIDDMLVYFLPCDKSSLPSVPHFGSALIPRSPLGQGSPGRGGYGSSPSHHPHSPMGGMSPMGGAPGHSYHHHHHSHHRSLFKPSFISAQKQHQQSMPVFDQAEAEIWRTETFLQVITEFWLNQNSFGGSEMLPLTGGFQEHFMPTMNHVKMVRLLVKYLHHFANSASSVITTPFQQAVQSPLDQFKRLVIPHILQKKLYTFLRHAFDRWPLDSCFRMVLETWLSYIQPWRYTDYSSRTQLEVQHSDTELNKTVDDRWDNFVEDNLLFYTVLTSEFIPRIYRMDLTSPHSAYMVYRVSRILSLPNLVMLILKAERELVVGLSQQSSDLGGSYLSSSLLPHLALPSQMVDMEGPSFQYEPFCSDAMRFNMQRVVTQLSTALETVRVQQQSNTLARSSKGQGFFASLFGGGPDSETHFSSTEYRRLPAHLEQAIHNFCSIFSISKPITVSETSQVLNASAEEDSRFLAEPESAYPECVNTAAGLQLTDLGRRQLINKERRFDTFYVGDPDLQPVRSYENATLVRLLFQFSCFINCYFQVEFTDFYHRPSFSGRFARVFLHQSLSPQEQQKLVQSPMSKEAAHKTLSQQPRLSLRFLASYRTLVHIALAYGLAFLMLGCGPVRFIFMVLSLLVFYGLLLASVRTVTGEPTRS